MTRPAWWNAQRDNALIAALQRGEPLADIGAALGRSVDSISTRASTLRRRHGVTVVPRRAVNQHSMEAPITQVVLAGRGGAPARTVSGRRERPCMCCGRTFLSEGAHNRLCGSCGSKSRSPFDL